jgi:sulfoxide reductase heme-binding subunit YedZ
VVAAVNDTVLWYTARASGLVSLVLLSATVMLGLLARLRVTSPSWPRFLSTTLHRDLSLAAIVFVALHVVTAVVDPYTHLGLVAATVPFGSYYRAFWLGLGTISTELVVAVIATSLLRGALGVRSWRAVHWLAYAAWPLSVAHSIGTGTDALSVLGLSVTGICVVSVVCAAVKRIQHAPADPLAAARRTARIQRARAS